MSEGVLVLEDRKGLSVHITGVVQGVGFRPFVYGLAQEYALAGWVRNTGSGVEIIVDGSPQGLDQFVDSLKARAPPLAKIDRLQVEPLGTQGFASFEIL